MAFSTTPLVLYFPYSTGNRALTKLFLGWIIMKPWNILENSGAFCTGWIIMKPYNNSGAFCTYTYMCIRMGIDDWCLLYDIGELIHLSLLSKVRVHTH